MRTRITPGATTIFFATAIVAFPLGTARATGEVIPEHERQAIAEKFAQRLAAEEFDEATEDFDETMTRVMGPKTLAETWKKVAEQCGEFGGFGPARHDIVGDYDVYVFPGRWKAIALDMQVTVTRDGKVTGLFFKPGASTQPYTAPSYINNDKFTERDLEFGHPDWRLKAKLSVPKGSRRAPGVVLVHGSGPNDMDETIGPNRPFRDLAWGLASRGIAVLRYNKRTHTYGGAMKPGDVNVRAEVVDDAVAALKTLREQPEVDPKKTFVIGHSLGGCLAPIIAEEDGQLAGVIVLAGTLRPMEDVVIEQLEYLAGLPGAGQEEAKNILNSTRDELETYRRGAAKENPTLMGVPMTYWQDLTSHLGDRGASAIRGFEGRVLVLSGGRDYQIKRADFDLWREVLKGRSKATFQWVPDVNHLFCKGKGMSTPAEYMSTEKHVSSDVVKGVARWIKKGEYARKKSTKKQPVK
ncbi:MAG: alpha/beta fold hydrolase [Planctomycetia bacterium]|nr:alpha/beta fold hydrolase [Planctomycetia bacterium]MCC7313505.1 alpha/beta fold hydrolase [Planctomycetota bacterium]